MLLTKPFAYVTWQPKALPRTDYDPTTLPTRSYYNQLKLATIKRVLNKNHLSAVRYDTGSINCSGKLKTFSSSFSATDYLSVKPAFLVTVSAKLHYIVNQTDIVGMYIYAFTFMCFSKLKPFRRQVMGYLPFKSHH